MEALLDFCQLRRTFIAHLQSIIPFSSITFSPMRRVIIYLALIILFPSLVYAQHTVTEDDYARAERYLGSHTFPLVKNLNVRPSWTDGDMFWYRREAGEGHEFIRVDPASGARTQAFDHARLAEALNAASDSSYSADELPFTSYTPGGDGQSISLVADRTSFTCDTEDYTCEKNESDESTNGTDRNSIVSPDGRLAAFIRDHNLWVRNTESNEETQLTTDGIEDYGYATNNAGWTRRDSPVLLWSPDSKKIATFQHDGRGVSEMYLVSTNVGAPKLERWKYPFVGDSLIFRISRVVIDVENQEVTRLQMPPDAHRSTTTDHIAGRGGQFLDVQWSDDGSELAFVSSSRDHKVATLRVANSETGEVRDVLEERTETYYESGVRMANWKVLFDSKEVVWFSERDNWGHLYLYDLEIGNLKRQITSGEWAVLQVRHIDESSRTVFFTAGGREAGDPYFQHFYKVGLDDEDITHLTPEPANHSVTMSPTKSFFIDSYSTPGTPPVTVLRNTNGETILELERADGSELLAAGWQPPLPVKVKARDGETDIYGLMYVPSNFDPDKSYPVLNYLYPGPQSGSVGTRSFLPSRSDKQAVAELGFVVVEVDAMGTPGRSKSFHDAYYGNMGDNGLPDQIAAIKQLAKEHSWMNLDKVGIWGHSGGGFASTRAILQYPDFYKVAVSGSGNHDNRNYEDDWGEKWQGLLESNPDGSTNYDNQSNHLLAKNLKGKLLIAHGMMDGNVPPSNTMLMVDALVEANKDFDLLVFPKARHGYGPASRYWMRQRWDYFVRHLHGVEPPKEFEFGKQKPGIRITQPTG